MILLAVSMITLTMLYHILARFEFQFIYLLYLINCVTSVARKFKDESTTEIPRDGFFSSLPDIQKNLSGITALRKLKCPDPSMIPLPAEVKVWLPESI